MKIIKRTVYLLITMMFLMSMVIPANAYIDKNRKFIYLDQDSNIFQTKALIKNNKKSYAIIGLLEDNTKGAEPWVIGEDVSITLTVKNEIGIIIGEPKTIVKPISEVGFDFPETMLSEFPLDKKYYANVELQNCKDDSSYILGVLFWRP